MTPSWSADAKVNWKKFQNNDFLSVAERAQLSLAIPDKFHRRSEPIHSGVTLETHTEPGGG